MAVSVIPKFTLPHVGSCRKRQHGQHHRAGLNLTHEERRALQALRDAGGASSPSAIQIAQRETCARFSVECPTSDDVAHCVGSGSVVETYYLGRVEYHRLHGLP